jgi:hypothetical protein
MRNSWNHSSLLSDLTEAFRLGCCIGSLLVGLTLSKPHTEIMIFRGRTYRIEATLDPYGIWISPVDH